MQTQRTARNLRRIWNSMDKQVVIEGLRHCMNNNCNGCPYDDGTTIECLAKLPKDALALIEGEEEA
jgi:hypothetical protein